MIPSAHGAETQYPARAFRSWFPVLPFIVYWIATLLLREFGPIIHDELRPATYVYVVGGLAGFIWAYASGLGRVKPRSPTRSPEETGLAQKWLFWTAPAALAGTAGLVLDRLLSGAGSLSRTLYETEYVRDEFAANTTWITTLSVAPYCFSLVSLAAYFACLRHGRVSRFLHALILLQMALLAFNTFLAANRGVFFWLLTYWVFYVFFVRGSSVGEFVRSRALRTTRFAFVAFLVVAVGYIYFIARYRNSEMYLSYLVSTELNSQRYSLPDLDTPALGALIHLIQYGTHEYTFIDAFLERAEPLAFNPGYLLGSRILNQVRRFAPTYETQGEITAGQWMSEAGLPPWAWPSVFGWLLAMFGYIGAPAFLALLGFACGRLSRSFLSTGSFGALVLVFCLYTALNMSFNWIGGDFQQNTGYVVGIALLASRRQVGS